MALGTIGTNQIASEAVTVPKVADQVLSSRNLIINGSMDIAQRGSSHTTEGYGSLDRYYLALSGASGVTMSQQAFSTADRNSLGFEKYLKLAVTTANNNCGVYQYIEASNAVHLIGKKATLSFYAKGTNPAGGSFTMQPSWYNKSSGGGDNAVAQSLTVTSSWVKYSFTFDIPAPANTVIDNNAYLSHSFAQPSGDTSTTAWELNLAGLQFELGDTATPFEHRSFGDELARCQRYYWQFTANNPLYAFQYHDSYKYAIRPHPVQMRASPTITVAYTGGSMTQYQVDNYHWKAYIASGTSDTTSRYVNSLKADAEL